MSEHRPFDPRAHHDRPGPIPRWSPHVVRRLLRRPALYWSAAILLAATSAILISQATTEARRLRADYGTTRPALVVARDVPAGTLLASAVTTRALPGSLLPDGALDEVPADAHTAIPLLEGTVITAAAIRDDTIANGHGALAIARTPMTPAAAIGARVVLIVGADPFSGIEATLIDGVVTAVSDTQLLVSVARRDLVTAGSALAAGTVVVALSGGP